MMTESIDTPAQPAAQVTFDISKDQIPSFAALQEARDSVFMRKETVQRFTRDVDALPDSGEEGRRKGLGLWMLARHAEAAALLQQHTSDDVASFTLAWSLMSDNRPAEAVKVFERLSNAYPAEPRPRAGFLEAQLEANLMNAPEDDGPTQAISELEAGLQAAPASFAESAEGAYLRGRLDETRRDWQAALEHYEACRQIDGQHRSNLFRMGYLAERVGLDDIALECYEVLAGQHPVDRKVLFNLGVLYEDMGRDGDAASCYDTIVKSDPTDARARLYLEDAKQAMDMYYDEDLERKEDRLNQILRIPITDFELSVRARNCLNKMNILTLGDLVRQTEIELLAYKNFGETSLNEIKEILASKGLRLGMAREEAVASIEASRRQYTSGENVEAMNRPISDLELSIRARRTVEALGCLTVGDICQHSEEELLGMPNFGVTSLQELKSKLTELGLELKSKA